MKLSLNEAKLTGLWASHCVTYSTGLDFPGLSSNEPEKRHEYEALVVQWYSKGQFVLYHNNPTREFLRKVLKAFI